MNVKAVKLTFLKLSEILTVCEVLMIFRQLQDKESSTFTYLLADDSSPEKLAIIIDPVIENYERDQRILKELGLMLLYSVETHIHADHITAGSLFKKDWKVKLVAGKSTNLSCADILLADNEVLEFGGLKLKALSTPGHTEGCTSYFIKDRVFTGDTLLIRGCGRTDFQGGSSEQLFKSVRERLFALPDSTLVFPGHDYKGNMNSSIGEEKAHNPRLALSISESEFVEIMANLNLPPPQKIEASVPRNQKCGQLET